MHVWIVNQYAVPPNRAGGTRHYTFAKHLKEKGWDCTLVASSFDHVSRRQHAQRESPIQVKVEEGVNFAWINTPAYKTNNWRRTWSMVSFARAVLNLAGGVLPRPDAIIGSSPHLFGAWAAERIARKWKVPFLLEVRDLWPESLIELGGYSRKHPGMRFLTVLERGLYRKADLILTLLPHSHEFITRSGGELRKIAWLPNGVDLDAYESENEGSEETTFKVYYTGSLGMANGLDTLLDAAQLLMQENSRVEIYIVGSGPELNRLKSRIRLEKIANTFMEGPVQHAQIPKVLKRASAAVLTLKKADAFEAGVSPNKLFDYMAAGCPIIFSAKASRNPVKESDCGLCVPPEDPKALAAAIKHLSNLPINQRKEMGIRGRRFVQEHHNYKRLSSRLADLLDFLCRKEPPRLEGAGLPCQWGARI